MKLKYINFEQFLEEIYEVEGIKLGISKKYDGYVYPHYKDIYKKPLPKGAELDLLFKRIKDIGVDI